MAVVRPTPRWTTMRPHAGQDAYYRSTARFNVVPAGRRSGKTEIAKRRVVRRAIERMLMTNPPYFTGRFFCAAPTRDQAKRIYWEDLKALIPKNYLVGRPRETDLIITLKNHIELHVIGMDKPERFEGSPWDGGILDEYGNMKEQAWMQNVLPALADRQGWCDLIGVPEGRNHYYERYLEAKDCIDGSMKAHHWKSADILPAKEIEMFRRMMDELSFRQELEAEFAEFSGQCYYAFSEETHVMRLHYNPDEALIFCFDFNVAPGVAAIIQEQVIPGQFEDYYRPDSNVRTFATMYGKGTPEEVRKLRAEQLAAMEARKTRIPVIGTGVIGEVNIKTNSNTPAVVRKLIQDWEDHRGPIVCYGDSTGGSKGTAKVEGSDWEIIERMLYAHYGSERVYMEIPPVNPPERIRINAVNTRLKTGDDVIRLAVSPECRNVIKDFGGVRVLEGGSGEIDKKRDLALSHISDAIGYYVAREFPIHDREFGELLVGGMY